MTECTASRHALTRRSYEGGCRCEATVEWMRAAWAHRARRLPRGKHRHAAKPRDPNVDWVNVHRAVGGENAALTVAERGVAIERLTRAGLSALRIAERLQISPRTVFRYRTGRVAAARGEAA